MLNRHFDDSLEDLNILDLRFGFLVKNSVYSRLETSGNLQFSQKVSKSRCETVLFYLISGLCLFCFYKLRTTDENSIERVPSKFPNSSRNVSKQFPKRSPKDPDRFPNSSRKASNGSETVPEQFPESPPPKKTHPPTVPKTVPNKLQTRTEQVTQKFKT